MNENNELNVINDKIEHFIRLSHLKILWWCCNASNTSEAEKFNRPTFYWIKVLSLSFKIPIIHSFRDESGKIKHPVLFNSSRSILECVNENELEMFCVKSYTESDIWSKLQKLLKIFPCTRTSSTQYCGIVGRIYSMKWWTLLQTPANIFHHYSHFVC